MADKELLNTGFLTNDGTLRVKDMSREQLLTLVKCLLERDEEHQRLRRVRREKFLRSPMAWM